MTLKSNDTDGPQSAGTTITKTEVQVNKDDLTTTKTSRGVDVCLISGSHKKMLLSMAGAAEKKANSAQQNSI